MLLYKNVDSPSLTIVDFGEFIQGGTLKIQLFYTVQAYSNFPCDFCWRIPSYASNSTYSVFNPFGKKSDVNKEKDILSLDVYFMQAEADGCSLYTDQGYYCVSYLQPEVKSALNIRAPNDDSAPELPFNLLKCY